MISSPVCGRAPSKLVHIISSISCPTVLFLDMRCHWILLASNALVHAAPAGMFATPSLDATSMQQLSGEQTSLPNTLSTAPVGRRKDVIDETELPVQIRGITNTGIQAPNERSGNHVEEIRFSGEQGNFNHRHDHNSERKLSHGHHGNDRHDRHDGEMSMPQPGDREEDIQAILLDLCVYRSVGEECIVVCLY